MSTLKEKVKDYLTTNYESVGWDKTSNNPILNGEEILSEEFKDLKENILVYVKADKDVKVSLKDITKPLIKGVVNDITKEKNTDNIPTKDKMKSWQRGMDISEKGMIVDSSLNNILFFEQHPCMKGLLYYNEIEQTEMFNGEALDDVQLSRIKKLVESVMGGNRSPINIKSAVLAYCYDHRVNPVKDRLEELKDKWDGVPRLETMFIKAYGCPDDEYHRYITKVFFYAWINRMLHPGCKFDVMFIFIGDQGIGKSSWLIKMMDIIGGKHAEGVTFSSERDNLEKLVSNQLCIMSELKSMKKSELEAIKELIGRNEDTIAKKYRSNRNFKRNGILVGSVNTQYKYILKDSAQYERRFILFDCKAEGTDDGKDSVRTHDSWWMKEFPMYDREQIWAEAMYMVEHDKDFQWQSLPSNIMKYLQKIQNDCKAIQTDDIFLQKLEDVLEKPVIEEGYDDYDRFVAAIENAKLAVKTPKSGRLQWIRKPVLRRYMKDVMKEDRSSEYFDSAMKMLGWRLETTRHDKKSKKPVHSYRYIRVSSTDNQTVMDVS